MKRTSCTTRLVIVNSVESDVVANQFAAWIINQKRNRPHSLYLVGINGTIGQGKTYFSRAVVASLNKQLSSAEGKALSRSLDDYYLPKSVRGSASFRAMGYDPRGISNRGPAGTHEVERLVSDLKALRASREGSLLELPNFEKAIDDRSEKPLRVHGHVGVVILEGWFVGALTKVEPKKAAPGLKRSVAQALSSYRPIFDQIDALWAFKPPSSLRDIVAQRWEQEETLRRTTGTQGMSRAQIERLGQYFYKDSWQKGVTSPFSKREKATFWATVDLSHRFVKIEPPCH